MVVPEEKYEVVRDREFGCPSEPPVTGIESVLELLVGLSEALTIQHPDGLTETRTYDVQGRLLTRSYSASGYTTRITRGCFAASAATSTSGSRLWSASAAARATTTKEMVGQILRRARTGRTGLWSLLNQANAHVL